MLAKCDENVVKFRRENKFMALFISLFVFSSTEKQHVRSTSRVRGNATSNSTSITWDFRNCGYLLTDKPTVEQMRKLEEAYINLLSKCGCGCPKIRENFTRIFYDVLKDEVKQGAI